MLGKDNKFLPRGGFGLGCIKIWYRFFSNAIGDSSRSENLAEQVGKLLPFAILSAAAYRQSQDFKAVENNELRFQFIDGAGSRSLVENLFLRGCCFIFR